MLETVAWISLAAALLCAVGIVVDEIRRPQKMAVMNIVWPVTALYLSVFGLWAYLHFGPRMAKGAEAPHHGGHGNGGPPTLAQSALAASHCGAGCMIADVVTEFTLFGLGATILGSVLLSEFVWDFMAAWLLGIVFQHFTIKPMRNLSVGAGIMAAIKADTLSILAFQVGMYGWMAVAYFWLFPEPHLHPDGPVYWLMMQVGMILGFATSIPMNRWIIGKGWKEKMG
jgi:Domain of unknown function (DUF4396)